MSKTFEARLIEIADNVEHRLQDLLSDSVRSGEMARPERLMAALRHGALDGGKRVRPFLLMETAHLFGAEDTQSLNTACALECIHCYSLIHDDLPSMDNDGLRRGKPTVHRAFDEATAILAGDSLLTLAFEIMASDEQLTDPQLRITLVRLLAQAAGIGGMIGGQMKDLAAEGRFEKTPVPQLTEPDIRQLQAMKTGALLRFACEAGARIGQASSAHIAQMTRFGDIVGLAFQLADDLLDETATEATVGKATGKDRAAGKATFVTLYGIDGTKTRLQKLVEEARDLLTPFGDKGQCLLEAARFIAARTH
ncbi:polyprenyl synthetase family protein [Coralliovum pocilloporae]|uniref:polyprenyl synthetase family protein n=1 Tax=Coralliovum pocilloporae TaxID=3066369 RepID=UPI0033075B38